MDFSTEKELESQYLIPTFKRYNVEFVSGSGMHLKDSEGREYLDFLSGIGVCSLGHCHPSIVTAIQEQAQKLIHVSNYFYIEKRGQVAEMLSGLLNSEIEDTQNQEKWQSFFANSGAEANECAIKLARLYASTKAFKEGLNESADLIVTLTNSFHGRTLATVAATGQERFQAGFEPIPSGFIYIDINDIEGLNAVFAQHGSRICAIMFEPIQGESGVHPCTVEFAQAIRDLCDKNDALVICDEVQSGIFRTGKPFGFQNLGITPDIVTVAKGIASGMPAAACTAKAHVASVMTPGKHGSTFGGSNLAISAAYATLTELTKLACTGSIKEVGEYLMSKLSCLDQVVEVRGEGLMVGAELASGIDATKVVQSALDAGLVINATGASTLRFLPPLICTKADVDEFILKLEEAFRR